MSRGGDTRFRKGQSGNPKGRPKKVRPSASAFDVIFDKTLTITRNGVERELDVEEALQLRTYQAGLAGNRSARREVLKMIAKREQWLADHSPVRRSRPVTCRIEQDPQNANEALLLLGIATRADTAHGMDDPHERLLLEPWAVEAALRRGRGLHIADKDRALLRRSVRGGSAINWS
jgi:hypothetical protein